ncbi:MAG: alpha-glucan family phosphorylase [Ilumatobacteraceae bacterium]|nr:alpha-glucan family phosphorylase [Ilumatobacteraceae bacterium]
MIDSALLALASNHRWSWHQPTRRLLGTLPGATAGTHPVTVLQRADVAALDSWVENHRSTLDELATELAAVVDAVSTVSIAYFSPEFGIAAELPQYSGGLGILAGDHLKSASDLALPLVGVGLFYREGFFRQSIDGTQQHERYEQVDPEAVGAVDTGAVVHVTIGGFEVAAKVWQQQVGATRLVLLDTAVDTNPAWAQQITDRLYSGGREHRLHQELMLGIGGVRALRALGLQPDVFHLNEGHACFLLFELLAEHVEAGRSLDDAITDVRHRSLFTTHTPVPAGIDRFAADLVGPELGVWADRLGVTVDTLFDWARLPSDPPAEPFNTAALAFELCGRANGVSQLHSGVSRKLFGSLPRAAGVEGITNGVHARTWVSPELQTFFDEHLGPRWSDGAATAWASIGAAPREAFDAARAPGRARLVDLILDRTGVTFDADRCIIGFARRFATYKRAALLLRDRDGLRRSLDAGAQFVFAGKAHPADGEGKAVLAEIAAFAASDEAQGRFALIPDYDIEIAQEMYGACDVWLNNPVRPREACGTSGEKSALNGGLNCSILDGWWADWFVDGIGWAIPTSDLDDPTARDLAEARALHDLLATEVLPTFDDRDAWWSMTTAMLRHLGPLVTSGRMVAEYDERFYRPLGRR